MRSGLILLLFLVYSGSEAQDFSEDSLRNIVSFLASDQLKGRGNYSEEAGKAAHYIASKFQGSGLKFFPGEESYFQNFSFVPMLKGKNS